MRQVRRARTAHRRAAELERAADDADEAQVGLKFAEFNMNVPHLFREHLPYTIKMLYGTITEAGKSKNEVTNNALMDAFCTNARALLEFFEKEHKRKAYTDNNYIAFSDQQAAKKIRKRLNCQVAHLIYGGRYTDPVAKINGRERFQIYKLLRTAIETFNAHLKDNQLVLPCLPALTIHGIKTASSTSSLSSLHLDVVSSNRSAFTPRGIWTYVVELVRRDPGQDA